MEEIRARQEQCILRCRRVLELMDRDAEEITGCLEGEIADAYRELVQMERGHVDKVRGQLDSAFGIE